VTDSQNFKVTKLDAAQRQLRTAILLWFSGGDPISIHSLAYAAYEVIHAISKRHNPQRRDLLFDSRFIREEARSEFNKLLKMHANFFKHANRDANDTIEFSPMISETFILHGILGLDACSMPKSDEEVAFASWLFLHDIELLTQEGREMFANIISIDDFNEMRRMSKPQFLEEVRMGRAELRRLGQLS